MAERKTDSGTIKAGEKSFTVGKQAIDFTVPNDIKYEYSWLNLTTDDVVVESEHVKIDEVIDAVNQARKNTARQTAYMAALAPFKPDTMTPEERIEQAKRNLLLAQVPADLVEQTIAAMRAQVSNL